MAAWNCNAELPFALRALFRKHQAKRKPWGLSGALPNLKREISYDARHGLRDARWGQLSAKVRSQCGYAEIDAGCSARKQRVCADTRHLGPEEGGPQQAH